MTTRRRDLRLNVRAGLALAACLVALLATSGCRRPAHFDQMEDKGRVKPFERIPFFADGRSALPLVTGTVAREDAKYIANPELVSGRVGDKLATTFPMPVTRELLERGRERYNIYCSPCHGLTGEGNGMVVQRGFVPPPSYHIDRLRQAPVGHFVDVISNGWGAMFSYNDRVKPEDRWAIAAYIRVLQLSRHAPQAMLGPQERQPAAEGKAQ